MSEILGAIVALIALALPLVLAIRSASSKATEADENAKAVGLAFSDYRSVTGERLARLEQRLQGEVDQRITPVMTSIEKLTVEMAAHEAVAREWREKLTRLETLAERKAP